MVRKQTLFWNMFSEWYEVQTFGFPCSEVGRSSYIVLEFPTNWMLHRKKPCNMKRLSLVVNETITCPRSWSLKHAISISVSFLPYMHFLLQTFYFTCSGASTNYPGFLYYLFIHYLFIYFTCVQFTASKLLVHRCKKQEGLTAKWMI